MQSENTELNLDKLSSAEMSDLIDKEFSVNKAEVLMQKALELEMLAEARLDLAVTNQQLQVELREQQARLEFEINQINQAQETAQKMIDILQPDADVTTKAMATQILLTDLLKLAKDKGLELAFPTSHKLQAAQATSEEAKEQKNRLLNRLKGHGIIR